MTNDTATMPAAEIENAVDDRELVIRYLHVVPAANPDIEILRGIDLEIRKGEVHAIMGRNGSGKTTTLKLITGMIEPDRGEIVARSDLIVSKLEQELPEPLRPLCRLQAFEISDSRWEFDVRRLAKILEPLIAEPGEGQTAAGSAGTTPVGTLDATATPRHRPAVRASGWVVGLAAAVLLAGGGALTALSRRRA